MEIAELRAWFDEYLATFVALCRGDRDDAEALLAFYSVPLLMTSDDRAGWLPGPDDVLAVVRDQMATMRAAGFDRTEPSEPDTAVVTGTCARHAARFVRRRADGSEIARFTASYVIADLPVGRRITMLAVRA